MYARILSILFTAAAMSTSAHPGGHDHGETGKATNRWELADGSLVEGTFLYGDAGRLVLEEADGSRIGIPLEALSGRDRRLAEFRMRRAAALNGQVLPKSTDGAPIDIPWVLLAVLSGIGVSWILTRRASSEAVAWHSTSVPVLRLAAFCATFLVVMACRKDTAATPGGSGTTTSIPRTRLGFLDSAFAPFKPAVATRSDNNWYYVESNGMPAHNMMVGITSWQQQVPIPHAYTGANAWSIPLQPEYAAVPLSTKANLMKGAVAIAVNGIPIFNALNNRGEDSYAIGELDQWGGHCGRADDYHYHAAPMHLSGSSATLPIAIGLDGFAVYGAREPDGSAMAALDTCHGHALGNGVYHYHGTAGYPYVIGAMRGKVSLDPATPAPENQILPQAFAKPARPATTPLKGATITDFRSTGNNAYSLTYRIGAKNGYVNYSWDAAGRFTYTLVDTSGASTTNTYQR